MFLHYKIIVDANLVYKIKESIQKLNVQGRMNKDMEMYRRSIVKFLSSLAFEDETKKKKLLQYCNVNNRLVQKVDFISLPLPSTSDVTDSITGQKRPIKADFFPSKRTKASEVSKQQIIPCKYYYFLTLRIHYFFFIGTKMQNIEFGYRK